MVKVNPLYISGGAPLTAIAPISWKGKSAKVYVPADLAIWLRKLGIRRVQLIVDEAGGLIVIRPIRDSELSAQLASAESLLARGDFK